jgi:hypothetical protein
LRKNGHLSSEQDGGHQVPEHESAQKDERKKPDGKSDSAPLIRFLLATGRRIIERRSKPVGSLESVSVRILSKCRGFLLCAGHHWTRQKDGPAALTHWTRCSYSYLSFSPGQEEVKQPPAEFLVATEILLLQSGYFCSIR